MSGKIKIDDYITPIKNILLGDGQDIRAELYRFIYAARKVNDRHLYKHGVKKTISRLLEPQWVADVSRFSPAEWRETAELVRKKTAKLLGIVPSPEIILFPGFRRFNGRVYKIGNRIVMGCAPDFPHCTGKDLKVLLAHEYGHFIRWRKTGVASDNVPIYSLIYEEGWAVWLSTQIFPEFNLRQLFMANLHKEINMPDPPGGYFNWCRKNLKSIAGEAIEVLRSNKDKDLGRFFQCRRFGGKKTPIRAGYYLGYKLFEMLSERMSARRLYALKPTSQVISGWLAEVNITN